MEATYIPFLLYGQMYFKDLLELSVNIQIARTKLGQIIYYHIKQYIQAWFRRARENDDYGRNYDMSFLSSRNNGDHRKN